MIWNLTKTEKDKAQITIYGPIRDFSSWFSSAGTSPDKVMKDLDELASAKEITLRINSGGGSAFAGMAIFELIRSHGAKITTRVDGLAASAASVIAMAGDRIIMGTGAMMMIHNPWTSVEGDAKQLRETADILDRVSESLVNVYQARTGKTREELRSMLDTSTWFTAEEAMSFGFADEIDKKFSVSAGIQGNTAVFNDQRFELGIFASLPSLPVIAAEPEPDKPAEPNQEPAKQDDRESETVKDLEELKAKHPDLYEAAVKAGVDQERTRIKALDELQDASNADIINDAKYVSGITAPDAAVKILTAQKQKLANAGNNLQADANASGINNVEPQEPAASNSNEEAEAKAGSIAAKIKERRGVK